MPSFKKGVVDIWVFDIRSPWLPIPKMLSKAEFKALEKMESPKARAVFLTARTTLRWLLEQYLGVSGRQIKFSYGKHGKPRLAKPKVALHFNISHSAEKIILAFSSSPVGIDIEKRVPRKSLTKLAKKCFSERHQQKLRTLKGKKQIDFFYKIWTTSEAYIKNLGESVYAIERMREKIPFNLSKNHQIKIGNYRLIHFELAQNYTAALSIRWPNPKVRIFED